MSANLAVNPNRQVLAILAQRLSPGRRTGFVIFWMKFVRLEPESFRAIATLRFVWFPAENMAKPRRGDYPDGHIRGDHIADRTMCLGQPQLGFNLAAGHAIGEQNRNTVKSAIARFIKKMDDRARLEGRICHRQLMWKRAEI